MKQEISEPSKIDLKSELYLIEESLKYLNFLRRTREEMKEEKEVRKQVENYVFCLENNVERNEFDDKIELVMMSHLLRNFEFKYDCKEKIYYF